MLKPNEQVSLWGVSLDTPKESKGFSDKIAKDGRGPLTFPLLSDPGHRIIDLYGLQDPQYLKLQLEGVPYPTVYVIDKSGRVAWARIEKDYQERPPNRAIRAALDALR